MEAKIRLGIDIKELLDEIDKYIESLKDVSDSVKMSIYDDLEKLDYRYESLMQEK